MKTKIAVMLVLACSLVAAAPVKTTPQTYSPIAIGAVRLANGVGEIIHAGLDWDSIPVFSLYTQGSVPGATVSVCWAVSGRMLICSSDPNDDSIYSFAIYDGKAPGVIFPELQ